MSVVAIYWSPRPPTCCRCTFTSCPYGVLAYYAYPKVTDSTFTSSSTYGIYLYDAAAEIDGCTLSKHELRRACITQYNSVTITDTAINGRDLRQSSPTTARSPWARDTVNNSGSGIYSYRTRPAPPSPTARPPTASSNGVYVYLAPTRLTNVQVYDSTTNGIYLNARAGPCPTSGSRRRPWAST